MAGRRPLVGDATDHGRILLGDYIFVSQAMMTRIAIHMLITMPRRIMLHLLSYPDGCLSILVSAIKVPSEGGVPDSLASVLELAGFTIG